MLINAFFEVFFWVADITGVAIALQFFNLGGMMLSSLMVLKAIFNLKFGVYFSKILCIFEPHGKLV